MRNKSGKRSQADNKAMCMHGGALLSCLCARACVCAKEADLLDTCAVHFAVRYTLAAHTHVYSDCMYSLADDVPGGAVPGLAPQRGAMEAPAACNGRIAAG